MARDFFVVRSVGATTRSECPRSRKGLQQQGETHMRIVVEVTVLTEQEEKVDAFRLAHSVPDKRHYNARGVVQDLAGEIAMGDSFWQAVCKAAGVEEGDGEHKPEAEIGRQTLQELRQAAHEYQEKVRQAPAPSVPRRTPMERAVASGETHMQQAVTSGRVPAVDSGEVRSPRLSAEVPIPIADRGTLSGNTQLLINRVIMAVHDYEQTKARSLVGLPPLRKRILEQIAQEREKQYREGYDPAHDNLHTPHDWIAILVRELGEAAFDAPEHARYTWIKVAAVAAAAAEAFDRKDPKAQESIRRRENE
jgi:hypothetical protein